MSDPLDSFKAAQRQSWASFAPLEAITMATAAQLIKHARIRSGQRVLDVACGTGVAAVTAARAGAKVTGLDLTPELLARAKENSRIADVEIDWHEGDAEKLPFGDASFDVVISQYGHMFAPRPELAIGEMLRVLKPGGTVAFSTWPPDLLLGRMFALIARYLPPPPPGVAPPPQSGDPNIIRQRLGAAVKEIAFNVKTMHVPALSLHHYRVSMERTAGPMLKVVDLYGTSDPAKLAEFRREVEALAAEYYEENIIRQTYLMTRATKI